MRWIARVAVAIAVAPALASLSAVAAQAPTPASGAATDYDGRPCATGTLISDFVVLGDEEAQPSCVQPITPGGAEVLYGLSTVPPELQLRGVERSTEGGNELVSVVYTATGGPSPGRDVVRVSLQRQGLSMPYPVRLLIRSQASAADFLPSAGLLLEPGAASATGLWFGPAGLYRITVESPTVQLDIRTLSALLTPVDSEGRPARTPLPPATGSGAKGSGGSDSVAVLGVAVGIACLGAAAGLARARHAPPV